MIRRAKAAASVLVVLLGTPVGLLSACRAPVEPALEPEEWDFGTVSAAAVLEQEMTVTNPGRRGIEVAMISTCDCLTVEPARFELPGGESRSVSLRYDPFGDEGEVRMQVIVRTGEGRDAQRRMMPAYGRVVAARIPAGEPSPGGAGQLGQPESPSVSGRPLFSFECVYDPGCKGCELLLVRQMIALQQELGIRLPVVKRYIHEPRVQESHLRLLEALGEEERAYPAVVFAGAVLQGDEEIEQEFGDLLRASLKPGPRGE